MRQSGKVKRCLALCQLAAKCLGKVQVHSEHRAANLARKYLAQAYALIGAKRRTASADIVSQSLPGHIMLLRPLIVTAPAHRRRGFQEARLDSAYRNVAPLRRVQVQRLVRIHWPKTGPQIGRLKHVLTAMCGITTYPTIHWHSMPASAASLLNIPACSQGCRNFALNQIRVVSATRANSEKVSLPRAQ